MAATLLEGLEVTINFCLRDMLPLPELIPPFLAVKGFTRCRSPCKWSQRSTYYAEMLFAWSCIFVHCDLRMYRLARLWFDLLELVWDQGHGGEGDTGSQSAQKRSSPQVRTKGHPYLFVEANEVLRPSSKSL